MPVICGWCGEPLTVDGIPALEGEREGICNNCLNLHFPHHADLIRGICEVKTIEEIFV